MVSFIVNIEGEESVETQVPMYVIEGQTVHMYCTFTHKSFYTLKVFPGMESRVLL